MCFNEIFIKKKKLRMKINYSIIQRITAFNKNEYPIENNTYSNNMIKHIYDDKSIKITVFPSIPN
jgi:putative IMPACT (imprinted ancient) family translation regulator